MNSNKIYKTSDNTEYVLNREAGIDWLLKHCSDNNLFLFDVEENTEITIKIKKSKTNGTTEG